MSGEAMGWQPGIDWEVYGPNPRTGRTDYEAVAYDEDVCVAVVRQALWDTDRAQVLIARDLDISQRHLSSIRQGHADPSLDLLRRMCALLTPRPLPADDHTDNTHQAHERTTE
jgi:hypothetical protein